MFGEEDHRCKLPFSYLIMGTYYQYDLTLLMLILISWLEIVFIRSLYCKVTLFFFSFYKVLFERKSLHAPQT